LVLTKVFEKSYNMTEIANNASQEIIEAYIVCGKSTLFDFSRKIILWERNEMIKISRYNKVLYIIKN
jgi:hypothetical protein